QITATFDRINAGRTGTVALWNSDFVLMARYPDDPDSIGLRRARYMGTHCGPSRPAETFENLPRDPASQSVRIVSCHAVEDYPLYVTVGVGRDEVLSGWRREASLFAAIALLCGAVIMLLARYITRAYAADLGSAEARLRDAIESIGDSFALFDADDRIELWNSKY